MAVGGHLGFDPSNRKLQLS